MYQAITVVHVLIALAIVGLVLLQKGKGADAGAGFGGGSASVFGARGSASFLSRTTSLLAAMFFSTSLTLAYLGGKQEPKKDIMESPAAVSSELPQVQPEKAIAPSTPADMPPAEPAQ